MKKEAGIWSTGFAFSDQTRDEFQRRGFDEDTVRHIEIRIRDTLSYYDQTKPPSRTERHHLIKGLQEKLTAASDELEKLDGETADFIEAQAYRLAHRISLEDLQSALREYAATADQLAELFPTKKENRLARHLAVVIADVLRRAGHELNVSENGKLVLAVAIVFGAAGIRLTNPRDHAREAIKIVIDQPVN